MSEEKEKHPQVSPPNFTEEEMTTSEFGTSEPTEIEGDLQFTQEESSEFSAPSTEVLQEGFQEESNNEGIGAGAWHNNKKITSLWSINETRNSWVAVSSLGWKKLANNHNSAIVAMTMLSSHAKDRNRSTKLRIYNNRVVEIYVW